MDEEVRDQEIQEWLDGISAEPNPGRERSLYEALYAGLAGMMIAIVYLYCVAAVILFGAEFNSELEAAYGRVGSGDQRISSE